MKKLFFIITMSLVFLSAGCAAPQKKDSSENQAIDHSERLGASDSSGAKMSASEKEKMKQEILAELRVQDQATIESNDSSDKRMPVSEKEKLKQEILAEANVASQKNAETASDNTLMSIIGFLIGLSLAL
ncbi:MAG: hypothetical protein RRB22_12140 [Gammaproteobacteria bacterium]|nr:hypothetical protein [Gammaproteobacteria bacterium]